MTPRQMLDALDVVAQHVQETILKIDGQAEEIAQQRMDLAMTAQHLAGLRNQVQAFSLEGERHIREERRNIDSHELAARVAGGARLKSLKCAS